MISGMKTRILRKISSRSNRKLKKIQTFIYKQYANVHCFICLKTGKKYTTYNWFLNPLERYILNKRRKKLAIKRKIRRFKK